MLIEMLCPKSSKLIMDITPKEELAWEIESNNMAFELYQSLQIARKQRDVRIAFEYLLEKSGLYRWQHLTIEKVIERCKAHNLMWKLKTIVFRLLQWFDEKQVASLS